MSFSTPTKLYHGNRYSADSECEHCRGIIRHEPWCITRNRVVLHAYQSVSDETMLSEQDRLILHALGVSWNNVPCPGPCSGAAFR
jgi:hypothetical protein